MPTPEGLNRLRSELEFLDDEGPGIYRDANEVARIEELERKIAPDDQSSAGFLD